MKDKINSILSRERKIGVFERAHLLVSLMSPAEKALWFVAGIVFTFSSFSILYSLTNSFTVEIPARGGTLVEGIIGTPRFANPILAVSDADRDMVALTYSGLMRMLPDGSLIPDLADHYSISTDGTVYTFELKKDLRWSDGEPVTASDVEYTIKTIQDPAVKSPKRASFEGVSAQVVNDQTITLTLKHPYAYFLEMTTIGIVPKHVWKNVDVEEFPFNEKNISPVGTGPFIVSTILRGKSGAPTEFTLVRNDHFTLGSPYLDSIKLTIFQNEQNATDALASGAIDSLSNVNPELSAGFVSNHTIIETTLGRIFGVFFNQNENTALLELPVRQALTASVNRTKLVQDVLKSFASPSSLPIPGFETSQTNIDASSTLAKNGWTQNADGVMVKKNKKDSTTLAFTLSVPNVPELIDTAKFLTASWQKIGASVQMKVFEPSDLAQNVIKHRKYDALLFGIATGKDPDLYAFWHSSQRNDPGANIALYTNPKADKLLEAMRGTTDIKDRAEKTAELIAEIDKDVPALFLYSPHFLYVLPKDLKGEKVGMITVPSDRFANVYEWYTATDSLFPLFKK